MPPLTRTLLAAALPLAAAACLPGAASASVVTYEGPPGAAVLVLRAAPGEVNQLSVQSDDSMPGGVRLYDTQNPITALPAQCEDHRDYGSITCPAPAGVRAELGDGADRATVSLDVAAPVAMLGGPGDDDLGGNAQPNALSGEDGNDTLYGSGGDDVLDGGEGNDSLDGYAGADRLLGGGGDDLLFPDHYEAAAADVVDGGPGVDRIEADWTTRLNDDVEPPVTLTMAGGADDGRPGEGDDIRSVERFTLSKGTTFTGTDAPEYVKLHQVGEGGDLTGMGGDDELRGGDGTDRIDGGTGDDILDGGFGDDTITGGPGRDQISADLAGGDCGPLWCKYPYGNDTVLARDGEVDSITCGAGTDRVAADAGDVVAGDCETVERPAVVVTPPKPGAVRLTVVAGQHLRSALRKGLKVRVTGGAPGAKVTVKVTAAGRIVARGTGRSGTTVLLRFTTTAKRTLAKRSGVRLTVAAGTVRSTLTLRR